MRTKTNNACPANVYSLSNNGIFVYVPHQDHPGNRLRPGLGRSIRSCGGNKIVSFSQTSQCSFMLLPEIFPCLVHGYHFARFANPQLFVMLPKWILVCLTPRFRAKTVSVCFRLVLSLTMAHQSAISQFFLQIWTFNRVLFLCTAFARHPFATYNLFKYLQVLW